jgi:hypothetical protein
MKIKTLIVVTALIVSSSAFADDVFDFGNQCKDGICEIFRVSDSISRGINNSSNVPGSNGSVIIVDTAPKVATVSCWKSARVPKPVYKSIVSMMMTLRANRDGSAPAAYTPAQQTMLLFYNTIMQQTLNFSCSDVYGN